MPQREECGAVAIHRANESANGGIGPVGGIRAVAHVQSDQCGNVLDLVVGILEPGENLAACCGDAL